jgi:hypothetical protein
MPKLTPTEMLMRMPGHAKVSSDDCGPIGARRRFLCAASGTHRVKGEVSVEVSITGEGVSPDAAIENAWIAWIKILGALE